MPGVKSTLATTAVADAVCAVLGASMGAVSTFTSGNAQPVVEYGTSKAIKGVCSLIPGGSMAFDVSYDTSKIATHAVKAQLTANNVDPDHVEGAMKWMGIDKAHYSQWSFFQDGSALKNDILSSFKKDKVTKLGFEIQTASGKILFSMSQISRDFMDVQNGAREGITRNALMWVMFYYIPQPVQPGKEPTVQTAPIFKNTYSQTK